MQLNAGYENSQPSILVRQPSLPAPFIPRPMQQSPWQATQTIQKAAQATKTSGKYTPPKNPVYKPPAPAPKPAPQPSSFRSPIPAGYKPVPIVSQQSVVVKPPTLPTNPFATPVAPNVSAWQQVQNMANQTAKNNVAQPAKPFSLAGAKAVKPASVNPNQISWTHGSVPDAMANLLGSGLKKLAASLVPRLVNSPESDLTNPTALAQKAAGTTDTPNYGLDALKYLLGGIATMGEKLGSAVSGVDDGTGKKQDLNTNGVLPSSGASTPVSSGKSGSNVPFAPTASPWQTLQALSGKPTTADSGNSMADFSKMQDTNTTKYNFEGDVPQGVQTDQNGNTFNFGGGGSGESGGSGGGFGSGGGGDMAMTSNPDGSLSIGGSSFSASDLMNLGLSADEVNALHSLAAAQAKQQNDVQRQALDTTQAQADATYGNDQQTVNNQLADNAQQLDNSSFQDYLKSRQAIADRGLASSGLSDAANTQLLLAKQQNMASLQRQADQALNSARTTHNNATADVAAKKALLNDATTAGTIYQNLYQNAMDAKQKNAQMALDWAKNQNDNSTKMGVAQLNNSTKMQIAQLDNQTKLTINENNNATDLQKNAAALDMQQQTLNSQNWNNSQKQLISMANQSYDQAKALLGALSKDPKNKDLQNQYSIAVANGNSLRSQAMNAVNFNNSSGGSGVSYPKSASAPISGNYAKGSSAFQSNISQAVQKGLPSSWVPALTELVRLESGWNPNAKNPNSTAYGYGQFLDSTRASYEKKMDMSYSDPVNQLLMMAQYVKDRYGTPENALNFWHSHNPHWY